MSGDHHTPRPAEITLRMYNVGFGDCFLLSFAYPALERTKQRAVRHLLVDFGSTERSDDGPSMGDVADLIREHTNGQLDVVVATHRHKDHISGFGGKETDAVMDALAPLRVIRPWTDDPAIATDATAPTDLDGASARFVRLLAERDRWLRNLAATPVGASSGTRRDTSDLAEAQLPNQSCIDRLDAWAADGRGVYAKAGDAFELAELPGVTIEVLGPPTLLQVPGLANEAFTSSEFWATGAGVKVLAGGLGDDRHLNAAYQALAKPDGYGEARWILDRLSRGTASQLFNVVRTFDDALNNTSLILLLRVGSRSLLLSGDAQIENWSHSLGVMAKEDAAGKALRATVADVDLYKVGHHGSRNATPKSLFKLWEPGGSRRAARPPLMTMMSTLPGKHGKKDETAVPRQTLVDALLAHTTLVRTDALSSGTHFAEVHAHTTGAQGFSLV